jgi:hypothetical protein
MSSAAASEHHRPEFSISTPETVLAGSRRGPRIHLASGVTVLSSESGRLTTWVGVALGVGRFGLIYSSGGALSASARLRAVELYGSRVVPLVRETLAEQPATEGSR